MSIMILDSNFRKDRKINGENLRSSHLRIKKTYFCILYQKAFMKLLFFDLETTGIKYWRNGIHQISGEIIIDGVTKESFNFNVCPHPQCEIEEEALRICNGTDTSISVHARGVR